MATTNALETDPEPQAEVEYRPVEHIRWLDDDEAREAFDAEARKRLGISGDEFLRRWDAGEYGDVHVDDVDGELSPVFMVWSLMSFVR